MFINKKKKLTLRLIIIKEFHYHGSTGNKLLDSK